jgi:dienelactone hydrolase
MPIDTLPLAEYSQPGPYRAGVVTLDLRDPEQPERRLPTDVWYPAEVSGFDRYPWASHPMRQHHEARDAAPPATGRFPLVAFSHGNSGLRRQSTFLTTHLASWGMVVTAPDHTGNTFSEMARIRDDEDRRSVHRQARSNRPRDLLTAIERVLDPAAAERGRWPEVVDERIGALGHSYGGWTALKLPGRDGRIGAVCGLAPASEPFVGRHAFEPDELPFRRPVPTLLVPALDDVLVDIDSSVWPLFSRLGEPKALVALRGADHFHFCDGLELLHGFHERNPRPMQTRPTLRYSELLPEARSHHATRALVAGFFAAALGPSAALPDLSAEALAALDSALDRLDTDGAPSGRVSASRC